MLAYGKFSAFGVADGTGFCFVCRGVQTDVSLCRGTVVAAGADRRDRRGHGDDSAFLRHGHRQGFFERQEICAGDMAFVAVRQVAGIRDFGKVG